VSPAAGSGRSDRLEVGRIGRAHGLRGDVLVSFTTDQIEARTAVGAVLYAGDRALEIQSARPQTPRWVVHFVGIDDRNAAEALNGVVVSADAIDDDDALWVDELIGTRVVEQRSGIDRGVVESVEANPAHDLLVLESGALVPSVFIVSCENGTTTIDPPDGLFD
jgi:16S rRNA processing protein RimM